MSRFRCLALPKCLSLKRCVKVQTQVSFWLALLKWKYVFLTQLRASACIWLVLSFCLLFFFLLIYTLVHTHIFIICFATPKCAFWHIDFKLVIKKPDSERSSDPPLSGLRESGDRTQEGSLSTASERVHCSGFEPGSVGGKDPCGARALDCPVCLSPVAWQELACSFLFRIHL